MLSQLAKNSNSYFFREFIVAVHGEMSSKHYMDNNDMDLVSFDEKQETNATKPLNSADEPQ